MNSGCLSSLTSHVELNNGPEGTKVPRRYKPSLSNRGMDISSIQASPRDGLVQCVSVSHAEISPLPVKNIFPQTYC